MPPRPRPLDEVVSMVAAFAELCGTFSSSDRRAGDFPFFAVEGFGGVSSNSPAGLCAGGGRSGDKRSRRKAVRSSCVIDCKKDLGEEDEGSPEVIPSGGHPFPKI